MSEHPLRDLARAVRELVQAHPANSQAGLATEAYLDHLSAVARCHEANAELQAERRLHEDYCHSLLHPKPDVRHRARGTLYRTTACTELQSSGGPVPEGTELVSYVGEDGKGWSRPKAEFDDGRFEPLLDDYLPEKDR